MKSLLGNFYRHLAIFSGHIGLMLQSSMFRHIFSSFSYRILNRAETVESKKLKNPRFDRHPTTSFTDPLIQRAKMSVIVGIKYQFYQGSIQLWGSVARLGDF